MRVHSVPSLPPVALGLRAAEDSAGFFGTLGTLKAAWAEEERPSTLSSSSKLRSVCGEDRERRYNTNRTLHKAGANVIEEITAANAKMQH